MAKAAHHMGTYHVRARQIREQANASPVTICWRCGLRLDQHPPTKTGRPPRWTAGHVEDDNGNHTGHLAPEANTCNFTEGARKGNRLRADVPRYSEVL